MNRLAQTAYPSTYGTWAWAYDAVGNRTSQTAPSGQTLYTYDGNSRLTQAGAVVYSYDANGNLTGTSAGQTFTYAPFHRMTQAVGTGGSVIYTYNGDGLKLQRVGPDGATRYYYDGIRPIWETDGAGAMIENEGLRVGAGCSTIVFETSYSCRGGRGTYANQRSFRSRSGGSASCHGRL